eukprot:scaffold179707_cov34-Tisochrysis_lutea.AAC.6
MSLQRQLDRHFHALQLAQSNRGRKLPCSVQSIRFELAASVSFRVQATRLAHATPPFGFAVLPSLQFFTTIADATPLPMLLYNVPGRTAADLQPETVARLAEHERIFGIKEATGDLERVKVGVHAQLS